MVTIPDFHILIVDVLKLVSALYSRARYPANTVRNITFVKVPFSSFMDDRNEDVLRTQQTCA